MSEKMLLEMEVVLANGELKRLTREKIGAVLGV